MRKTKIICTIGPACESEDVIRKMCLAGMNVARMNFSHGTHSDHLRRINTVKKVRRELSLPIAILLDTKGPEYRIGIFEGGKATVSEGDEFTFTTENIIGDKNRVSVDYAGMINDLAAGDIILVNNGLLSFKVDRLTETEAVCTVINGGEISDKKSMSFPDKILRREYLSEQDKDDIRFGIEQEVDFIACSFVSRKQDLDDVSAFIATLGRESPGLIAKIENRAGIDNIEDICSACEGVMIGRGDMGVEIPFAELPAIQKQLITKCRMLGKRVITATEMLESMVKNPRPTRAEISDVANAVYDGTSAIMLSAETAAGKHPALCVKTMADIAEETEKRIHYARRFTSADFSIANVQDAVSHASCTIAINLGAKTIAVCTRSGATARMVSRFRPPMDIVGITVGERNWLRLALSWGVIPVMCEEVPSPDVLFYMAKNLAKNTLGLKAGDRVVITGGRTEGKPGNTNIIKVETV